MYHCFRLRRGAGFVRGDRGLCEGASYRRRGSGFRCGLRLPLAAAGRDRCPVRSGEEDVEIVSLMGTVSEYGCHLHASFSREDLSAFGGHLLPGCTVNTTAEIVLAEIRSCVFTRRPDSETGYEELEIGPAYPEETRNDRREER